MFLVIVIFVVVLLATAGVIIFLFDTAFGGNDFATGKSATKQIIQIINDRKLGSGSFYDLGSCRGGLVIKLSGKVPNLQIRGIDSSKFRTFFARARCVFQKNPTFQTADIFITDISSADIVYAYLPRELMPNMQTKLQKELKPGAVAVTYRVSFPSWQPIEHKGEIFVYVQS